MKIFNEIDYNLEGKEVCIIGRGKTCAKPLIQMMLDKNATVTICHSYTKDLDSIKEGAVVINVGLSVNPKTGKLTGDVDFAACKDKAGYITKNIGGVGLLTTACLAENVVELYERRL